jgi:hypothetical protein
MRNTFPTIMALALAAASSTASTPALAMDGCCKQREWPANPWRKNGASFETCEQRNRDKDNDNIFVERGRVWWDSSCK